jgi:nucleotide-binding universal stress UspA family protein
LLSEKKFAILVNNFVNLIRADPNAGKNKIKRYVMTLKQQSAAKKYIYKLETSEKNSNVPIFVKIKQGTTIVKAIINFAKSKKFSLIVMGSSGRGGFDKILLGSVANGVAQQAKYPVLIIK